jgi:hypothetical protein
LHRRLGGPPSQSGHYGEEKNLFHLPGIETQFIQPTVKSMMLHITSQFQYLYKVLPNTMAEWLMLPFPVLEVLSSKFRPKASKLQ